MVLIMLGRKIYEIYSKEFCYMWEFLVNVFNDMVIEV